MPALVNVIPSIARPDLIVPVRWGSWEAMRFLNQDLFSAMLENAGVDTQLAGSPAIPVGVDLPLTILSDCASCRTITPPPPPPPPPPVTTCFDVCSIIQKSASELTDLIQGLTWKIAVYDNNNVFTGGFITVSWPQMLDNLSHLTQRSGLFNFLRAWPTPQTFPGYNATERAQSSHCLVSATAPCTQFNGRDFNLSTTLDYTQILITAHIQTTSQDFWLLIYTHIYAAFVFIDRWGLGTFGVSATYTEPGIRVANPLTLPTMPILDAHFETRLMAVLTSAANKLLDDLSTQRNFSGQTAKDYCCPLA